MELIEQNEKWMERTRLLVGTEAIEKLKTSHVLVIGLGGVGSYCAEAIARAGVGEMTIVDGDVVDPSNRNRQLQALYTTHGQSKAELMAERILQINPNCKLHVHKEFKTPDKMEKLLQNKFDYVVDAIDSITPKVFLIKTCHALGHPIVSSMGAGGKLDPTKLKVADISKTEMCPFAQQVRKVLKTYGIRNGIKTVYSTEPPDKKSVMFTDGSNFKKSAYGTVSFIPAVFGLACASVVIRDLIGR
ncbi:MAG: UBA/THIF-type binding protein [Bacteroidetes bacterium]|jgi:tRNA A37 threonylcarbamoyladenosine dehydratase|nr:UBA/THIF-type binding protein [Bacteroidota bacterium]